MSNVLRVRRCDCACDRHDYGGNDPHCEECKTACADRLCDAELSCPVCGSRETRLDHHSFAAVCLGCGDVIELSAAEYAHAGAVVVKRTHISRYGDERRAPIAADLVRLASRPVDARGAFAELRKRAAVTA